MTRIQNASGFTMVEMAISLVIFTLLASSLLSLSLKSSKFMGTNDAEVAVQLEGNRALSRMTEVLRKTGRVDDGVTVYPRVVNGGQELEFRILEDIDGNGYPFEEWTGNLEWSPKVFTLKKDENANLRLFNGTNTVFHLGRYVHNLSFQTVIEDPALHFKEIRVTFETRRPTDEGYDVVHSIDASIHMRN